MLLDAHCHIDQFPNPAFVAAASEKAGVTTVAVTNLPSHYKIGSPPVSGFHYIKLALGFHPLAVGQHYDELGEFLRMVPEVSFVGEIGLDFSKEGLVTKTQQLVAFRAIAKVLAGTHKFITLHSRGAADTVLDTLQEHGVKKAVFHWYSGSLSVLDRAIDGGFFFSVNPAMIRSEKGCRIINQIPRERILTETDGPYVKIRSCPAEPIDVSSVVDYLASVWQVSAEEVSLQVWRNLHQIVGTEK